VTVSVAEGFASAVLHTGFTVSNLDRSVAWYCEQLGLVEVRRFCNDKPYARQIVGMEDAILDVSFLGFAAPDGAEPVLFLELIQYRHPVGEPSSAETNDPGIGHIALAVDDLRSLYERLSARGAHFVNPPTEIPEGSNKGGWACYLRDPDGITIELIELASKDEAPAR
jgi:catechol 2,3-dioxygenase-like lactoylglutathione lyase family enzyme